MTASSVLPQTVTPRCFPMPARVLGTASPSSAGGGLAEIEATESRRRLISDPLTRLMAYVEVSSSGCWLWQGRHSPTGYAQFRLAGQRMMAHRAAYMLLVGPIPHGLDLDHLCRVRHCVNPGHLEPVTRAENNRRGLSPSAINARKTHCKNGHELTPENTRVNRAGRICRICNKAAKRAAKARKRPAVAS